MSDYLLLLLIPVLINKIKSNRQLRFFCAFSYTALLTWELLLTNPWVLFGEAVMESPPLDTATGPASFLVHFAAYGALGFIYSWACRQRVSRAFWLAMGFALCHAFATEALQSFIPNRWPSWEDVSANVLGLGLGAMAAFVSVSVHRAPKKAFLRTHLDNSTI